MRALRGIGELRLLGVVGLEVGMFPLILTVLNRDRNRGYSHPFFRTLSTRGNIPI